MITSKGYSFGYKEWEHDHSGPKKNGPLAESSDWDGIMTSEQTPKFGQDVGDSRRKTEIDDASHRVIKAVAEENNKSVSELEPLYYSIDPVALDSLFSNPSDQTVNQLTFTYSGYQITINGEGSIDIVAAHGRSVGEN
ncbi:HalOD1 output domain-containing protein [Natrialba sp. SSL1]|uniref:HalOD1 output domain-containing protein n=1 Tax=Natrialba sp. SSL1 TaxID=1869245 RepID=UPI001113D7E5|nr:HalOD1 output domain-containing protein [Natrialba sp. SSL1]